MPPVLWTLHHGRPMVRLNLQLALGAQALVRTLLADTGAGAVQDPSS